MKLRSLQLAVPLLGLLVALPVSADAPLTQYKAFTQRDTQIEDAFTKLKWDRNVFGPANHATATTVLCPGNNRLPTLKELLSLVDEDVHEEYEGTQRVLKAIDQRAFPNTPVDAPYWTSTEEGTSAWTVDFRTGETQLALKTDTRRVRCVVP